MDLDGDLMRYNLEPNGQLRITDENEETRMEINTGNSNDSYILDYKKIFTISSLSIFGLGIFIAILPWIVWQWILRILVSLVSIIASFIVVDEDDEDAYSGNFVLKGITTIVSIILLYRFGTAFAVILQCVIIVMTIESIIMYIVMIVNSEQSKCSLILGTIILILNIVLLVFRFKMF